MFACAFFLSPGSIKPLEKCLDEFKWKFRTILCTFSVFVVRASERVEEHRENITKGEKESEKVKIDSINSNIVSRVLTDLLPESYSCRTETELRQGSNY